MDIVKPPALPIKNESADGEKLLSFPKRKLDSGLVPSATGIHLPVSLPPRGRIAPYSVLTARGMAREIEPRRITSDGDRFQVGSAFRHYPGMLSGVPRNAVEGTAPKAHEKDGVR